MQERVVHGPVGPIELPWPVSLTTFAANPDDPTCG
jgi:hypothetical protein